MYNDTWPPTRNEKMIGKTRLQIPTITIAIKESDGMVQLIKVRDR